MTLDFFVQIVLIFIVMFSKITIAVQEVEACQRLQK